MSGSVLQGIVQIAGAVAAQVFRLDKPISFWGGVDPATGHICDPRHPNNGGDVSGKLLVLPGTIGSSSSSYIMLELMANVRAPAALILAEPDAILALGVIVAREMGYGSIPVLLLPLAEQATLTTGVHAQIADDGTITAVLPS
jgi:predicted aconitase with swiveling domain